MRFTSSPAVRAVGLFVLCISSTVAEAQRWRGGRGGYWRPGRPLPATTTTAAAQASSTVSLVSSSSSVQVVAVSSATSAAATTTATSTPSVTVASSSSSSIAASSSAASTSVEVLPATASATAVASSAANTTSPYTPTEFHTFCSDSLWSRNNTLSKGATALLELSSGADYSYFRNEDLAFLGSSVSTLYSAGDFDGKMSGYIDTMAEYIRGINHIVNDNVGGSTRADTLEQLGYSLQAFVYGFQVVDRLSPSTLTAADRKSLVSAWTAIMADIYSICGGIWVDGSFHYFSFSGLVAAVAELQHQASVAGLTIPTEVGTIYAPFGAKMFEGFFNDFPGNANSTAPAIYEREDGTHGLIGGGGSVYGHWNEWPSDDGVFMTSKEASSANMSGFGTSSDSSGYGFGDIVNLAAAWLSIRNTTGADAALTTYTTDAYAGQLADYIESFTPLFMGLGEDTGYIPPYGDANWADNAPLYWSVFEIAASVVVDSNPAQAARLKYYANMASRFSQSLGRSLSWRASFAPTVLDSSLVATAPSTSKITTSEFRTRPSTWGETIKEKAILRGTTAAAGTNSFALINLIGAMSFGHSHPSPGNILAHAHNGSVLLRSMGYAASYDTLQNNVAVRRSDSPSFLNYEESFVNGVVQAYKWDATTAGDNQAVTTNISAITETDTLTYVAVSADIVTGSGLSVADGYNFALFHHTRQIVLHRASGALIVYDAITPAAPGNATAFAFGQIWHAAEIVANATTTGGTWTVQNGDYYEFNDGKTGTKGDAFVIKMAGGDAAAKATYAGFNAAMAGYPEGWAKWHFNSEAKGVNGKTTYGFVSVISPGSDVDGIEVAVGEDGVAATAKVAGVGVAFTKDGWSVQ
ncbi:hypothetical protein EDC01DRAFT_787874 [Geopyxis carbonaria]|nr:hypothetical protein EDC01DRAFT_787874 [Geopyxis carbonaria]